MKSVEAGHHVRRRTIRSTQIDRSKLKTAGAYSRSQDAVATTVGDRIVLYHRVSRTAIVLNPTGRWMWSQLDRARTAGELAQHLRNQYPALSRDDADRDVSAFLADLSRHAFVSAD